MASKKTGTKNGIKGGRRALGVQTATNLGPYEAPTTSVATAHDRSAAHIVRMVPRTDLAKKSAKARALAGEYRVIHGSIEVPLPASEWQNNDGSEKIGAPKTVRAGIVATKFDLQGEPTAWEGDIVYLGDEDAARLLDLNIIESLHASPSRCGQVWNPPKSKAA